MSDLTRDFNYKEFRCHCGKCKFSSGIGIDEIFVQKLQMIRDWVDTPLKINSALRCKIHNKYVGGSKNSNHLTGIAADIHCISPRLRMLIISEAISLGLTIGVYKRFLHLDMRKNQICFFGETRADYA